MNSPVNILELASWCTLLWVLMQGTAVSDGGPVLCYTEHCQAASEVAVPDKEVTVLAFG